MIIRAVAKSCQLKFSSETLGIFQASGVHGDLLKHLK